MKLIHFLRIALLALLVTIAGCGSDDHEGVFNENTNGAPNDGVSDGLTSGSSLEVNGVVGGVASDVRISEPAFIYIIDGAGSLSSTTIEESVFTFTTSTSIYPLLIALVPSKSGVPDWSGSIQTKFIFESPVETIESPTKVKAVSANLKLAYLFDINPITTSVTNLILKNHSFDAINYLKKLLSDDEESVALTTTYTSLSSNLTVDEFDQALTQIVGSWGKNSDSSLIFNVELFNDVTYMPRKEFTEDCSVDQVLIEALSNTFGSESLGNLLVTNSETNADGSSNLLNDSKFQSGLLLALFSLNHYQPLNELSVSNALADILNDSLKYSEFIDALQSVLDDVLSSEKNKQSTESEVLLKIQNKLAASSIPTLD